jgi:uncharacterized membrane protein YgdD (TMEM256/DUF423 family)
MVATMAEAAVAVGAVAFALLLSAAMHRVLSTRQQWLTLCLLLALAYVCVSLRLERPESPEWLGAVRWGLFGATVFAFVRFRWFRRFSQSAKLAKSPGGPPEGPKEQ